jgi:two-component system response regulator FixJ
VDDDVHARQSVLRLLSASNFEPIGYSTPLAFLDRCTSLAQGCVLLEVPMPGLDGFEVQAELKARKVDLPVIILTTQGDVATAVRAMKSGVIDYIEKPFDDMRLVAAIEVALNRSAAELSSEVVEAGDRISSLSPREREVLDGLVLGRSNKEIARDMVISVRTVEVHRSNMLERLGVHGLGAAVRLAVMASLNTRPPTNVISRHVPFFPQQN